MGRVAIGIAFGIGTSQVRDVLASQSLALDPLKVRRIDVNGTLAPGVYAKDVILTIIRRLGYDVDVAGHGGEALQAMASATYDAVILDCHMPVMDGFEAAAEIRRREAGAAHLPIIALTADASDGVEERCTAAGMDLYLTKPVGRAHLSAVLERFCTRTAPDSPRI